MTMAKGMREKRQQYVTERSGSRTMKLTCLEVTTTSSNPRKGNVVELSALCLDVEDPKVRWAETTVLIDNNTLVGTPDYLSKCHYQLGWIANRNSSPYPVIRMNEVKQHLLDWMRANQCGDDEVEYYPVGDAWDVNVWPWLEGHVNGMIHVPKGKSLDIGSLCYVEGSPVPTLVESLESLGIRDMPERWSARDRATDVATAVSQFFRG